MSERSNAGYIIISTIRVGDAEYVLGENPNAPARFVTWMCRNGSDYFWGRCALFLDNLRRNTQ